MDQLYQVIKKINRLLQKAEMAVGCVCLFVLLIVMLANAGGRYLLRMPILWSDELNNILFVWFGFLACAYIMGEDRHLRVTALIGLFPPGVKYVINTILNLVMLVLFSLYLAPLAKLLGKVTFSGIMRIPLQYVYLILPLSFGLMCFHIIHNIIKDFCLMKNQKREEARP